MIGAPTFLTAYGSSYCSIVNNRYKAVHLGLSGKLFRSAPYRLMFTVSDNYGTYARPYISPSSAKSGWNWWEPNTIDQGLMQVSAAFTGYVPFAFGRRSHMDVLYGLYADYGKVLPRNVGGMLGIRYSIR